MSSTPTAVPATAAEMFEQFRVFAAENGIALPHPECYPASAKFVAFAQERGLDARHTFIEFDRGRDIVEHYVAWFPKERVAYDLAPQNADPQLQDATHKVYTPEAVAAKGWRQGYDGIGWP